MFKWDKKKKKSSFNELNSLSNTSTPHSALLSRFDSFHSRLLLEVNNFPSDNTYLHGGTLSRSPTYWSI